MPIGISGDPESLFCAILQSQYQMIIATLEAAIMFPLRALQLVKSAIQMMQYVIFVAADIALTKIEAWISEMFDLENVGLENARRNFCKVAYSCKVLTDYLFGPSSPLKAMGFNDERLTNMKNNYTIFEEYVCNKSFKGLLDQFKTSILGDVSRLLDEVEDSITNGFLKLNRMTAKYNAALDDYHVFDYLGKLDDFSECAFAACNFISTSENKQADIADKMKLIKYGDTWIIDPNLFSKINTLGENLHVRIDRLRDSMTACANKEPNPNDGVKPDDIAK